MNIQSVYDEGFARYGKVLEGHEFSGLLKKLVEVSEKPADRVIYVPGDESLEAEPAAKELENRVYGGMPVQVGYCNGNNRILNCLEYHRDSEINIAADDIVLLLAPLQSITEGRLNTAQVEAFLQPAGTAVQLYETSLHYAPCTPDGGDGFRVIVVLPKGTNTGKPDIAAGNGEDKMLWARNKWLLAHPDAPEAKAGAYVGLTGSNITL